MLQSMVSQRDRHDWGTELNFLIYKLDLEKAEEPEILMANIHWITEKARKFQENIYFRFIDYAKAFDCVDHNKMGKS